MWKDKAFPQRLEKYLKADSINSVILIDNDYRSRPSGLDLNHKKIETVCYRRNIYVNPAWNEGYFRSKSSVLCFLNDDIDVDVSLFDYVKTINFDKIDIIGVHLKGSVDNYHIVNHPDKKEELIKLNLDKNHPIGGQAYAFGVCMFVKRSSYKVIPSLYQVWYGDDYLVQRNEYIYALKTNKISGEISKTIVSESKSKTGDVQRRIDLDSLNAYNHNHFMNGKNWDLLKNAYQKFLKKPGLEISKNLLEQEYESAKRNPSDINENVNVLYELAKSCKKVTEMGVRTGVSTRAFLYADVELTSYDIKLNKEVMRLFDYAKTLGKNVKYIEADVLTVDIEETDLLFIDTLHTYKQLKKELELHGNKSKRFIAFHDTYTFGLVGEFSQDKKGLLSAIIEFMIENKHWSFSKYMTNNNGMLVLERQVQ